MYDVISGPPPCTMTGLMPTSFMSTMSLATCSRSSRVGHRRAAVLDDDGLARRALDVGQRLGERLRLGEQVLHVVSSQSRGAHRAVLPVDAHVVVGQVAGPDGRRRRRRGAGRRRSSTSAALSASSASSSSKGTAAPAAAHRDAGEVDVERVGVERRPRTCRAPWRPGPSSRRCRRSRS